MNYGLAELVLEAKRKWERTKILPSGEKWMPTEAEIQDFISRKESVS
jgi:hypothetical protein